MNEMIVPTGFIIKEYLDVRQISQKNLSQRINVSERHLSKMLNGKTRLTEDMALKLEKVMPDVPASYWLNYETKYQEHLARERERSGLSEKNLKEISKRYHFKEVFKGSDLPLVEQAIEMLKLLGISSFEQFGDAYPIVATEFMQDSGEPEAIVLWLKLCESDVEEQNANLDDIPYREHELIENLSKLRLISANPNVEASIKSCRKLLNKCGIYLVYEPPIEYSKVRGALTTYNDHPALYISGRFKSHDHIWFTILHEIAHLLLHYDDSAEMVFNEELSSEELKDDEANQFAREFFIGKDTYRKFVAAHDNYDEKTVRQFAAAEGLSPDIVVGFLQHDDKIEKSQLNHLKTRI